MPNIGVVLKQEIARLCRREIRKEIIATKKATWVYRRDIAALKRKVAELEQRTAKFRKLATPSQPAPELPDRQVRFVAKGFRAHRTRLGLSAAQMAKLLDVSEQSIYNWETKKSVPRKEQMAKIVALRALGKREAHQRLAQLTPPRKAAKQKK
jgi:DNA-binding XRE family transcriptional regulator